MATVDELLHGLHRPRPAPPPPLVATEFVPGSDVFLVRSVSSMILIESVQWLFPAVFPMNSIAVLMIHA